MRIAITAVENSLDANVDPRFGRCAYFLIVDTDTMALEAIENPNIALGGGAGIQSAQLLAGKGAQFVLTGNCGPNAYQALNAANIGVVVGCSGVVRNVIEQFKSGQFGTASEPNVASHFGTGNTTGVPQQPFVVPQQPPMTGGGTGRGMGQGGGGGMGRGQGGGRGMGRGQGGGGGMGRGQGGGRGMGRGQGGGGWG